MILIYHQNNILTPLLSLVLFLVYCIIGFTKIQPQDIKEVRLWVLSG